ncbi:phosphotransferase family protein, partial [Mycolicibacterium sp.]
MGTENRQPPGGGSNALGIDSIEQWLADVTGLHRPMTWIQLAGGHSNLTFRVEGFDGTAIVVRRPPVGRLQHAAHDMHREFRVISALWPTEVSVPKPIAITEDPTHTDAPTYAMQWVEGRTPYSRRDIEDYLDLDARDRLSRSFIDTLAALHSLDPDTVGLGDLGKRTSYLERQLHSWHKSLQASSPSGADERLERIHRLLVE